MLRISRQYLGIVLLSLVFASSAYASGPSGSSFSWTGLYVGGHGGYAWSDADWFDRGTGQSTQHDVDGSLGGGHVGFNFQSGNWVFGAEISLSGGEIDGSAGCTNINAFANPCKTDVSWLTLALGRLGYAFGDDRRSLLYIHGGYAGAKIKDDLRFTGAFLGTGESSSKRHNGWAIGGGLEYAWHPRMIVGIDYTYVDLGTERHDSVSTFAPGAVLPKDIDLDGMSIVRARLSFKIN